MIDENLLGMSTLKSIESKMEIKEMERLCGRNLSVESTLIIIVSRSISTQKRGLDDTNKFMLDLILAKDIKNRMPFRFRCSGLFLYFPDHTGGPSSGIVFALWFDRGIGYKPKPPQ